MASSIEEFEVTVHTSPSPTSGTYCYLRLNLIGSEGETPPLTVNETDQHLLPGGACVVRVLCESPVGRVVLVRLCLEARPGYPKMDWHCSKVEVRRLTHEQQKEGEEEVEVFPCDKWLRSADGDVELRNGKMCLLNSEREEKLRDHRLKDLQCKQNHIRWRTHVEGAPHCADINAASELGPNLSYTRKSSETNIHYLSGFATRAEPWKSLKELEMLFVHNGTDNSIADFVHSHWSEDWFFGYQFLNGCNPLLVRRIRVLPTNLSVTTDMLRPFLPDCSSLEQELERGTLYLLDFEVLEGVPANVVNGKQHYLTAPLCLLHLNQQGQLKPIAIQLQQTPGPQNPVFLPSDPACDWLLAKIWVRSADFQCHQLISHYLKAHMMGELCCTATLRTLPEVHPIHQLLMPHVRTTLQINAKARASLLGPKGLFDKAIASGLEAVPAVLSRATLRLNYRSLCVPDDLADRGLNELPQCYYAQDARRVWDALHNFVTRWTDLWYHRDEDVQQDPEIQSWISEIYTHGFLKIPNSGFPRFFQTKAELNKFITMIIFSCSALHAAVNFSQLDFGLWMPNTPASMARPPPQAKGLTTEDDLLSFLPDVNSTCSVIITLALLAKLSPDFVPLCHYREAVFKCGAPRRLVEEVQAELKAISDDIADRNRTLVLPYSYLSPDRIENSVAI